MPTNIREEGFESLIVDCLVNQNGCEQGTNDDYSREYALDETRLFRFLADTQSDEYEKINLAEPQKRVKFLDFLQGELARRGIIDILRNGVRFYPADLILFYSSPTERNTAAKVLFEKNIFSVTRQLRYSNDEKRRALDFVIFINGLPLITAELKNRWTKQNVEDAVIQYKTDRDPRELIFQFKRCMAHFAVDDAEVRFCTKLEGKKSWFLPFNKGYKDGAGNPPNPKGLATAYLWEETFSKTELANIIENYAQVVEKKDSITGKKKQEQIFPRFHQLALVKALLADVQEKGVGGRYLVQHSAGSGKSNSIAWLAHQLVGLEKDGKAVVDSILVVTDRRNLDAQIRNTIKQFMQVSNTVVWAEHANDLREAIETGKKIIITTIQKFPFIMENISGGRKGFSFAIIIDEAHSSQSGNMAAEINIALSGNKAAVDDDCSYEDLINQIIEDRKLLPNASYFAFTATPKNKTLELFGVPYEEDGKTKHRPFHNYSMKQAIEEDFILDVLQHYTPVESYYHIRKTIENDPLFDKQRAQKRLRRYVESDPDAIRRKAEILVDHFHESVYYRINQTARAMVVTGGIERAITYYYAITEYLTKRKSPYKAIVAFTGDKEYNGKTLNESTLNGFPTNQIEEKFKNDPYRFLICADKFQTGYDEPLLHTMYVDKMLTDIKAVQTLSRLNRAHPGKNDTFVLDFANKPEDIKAAFSTYYKTTLLSDETDPNKLYELISKLEKHEVYTVDTVGAVVSIFLKSTSREKIDPSLDGCVVHYKDLDEDAQVAFKGSAKSFVRIYNFLAAILPYSMAQWEKLSIFLTLLIPKLPAPREDDFSGGILRTVDLDSYRAEIKETLSIRLEDKDVEVDPISLGQPVHESEPEIDYLSHIIADFNKLWGSLFKDPEHIARQVAALPVQVAQNTAWQNAKKNAGKDDAHTESNIALNSAMLLNMDDGIELYKLYCDNPSFKAWLQDMVFTTNYTGFGDGPFV